VEGRGAALMKGIEAAATWSQKQSVEKSRRVVVHASEKRAC
jgi:hypothetical protein